MHGGGWMQGSPETHKAITVGMAQGARHTIISVDDALAPEHLFPAALRDCEAVVRWAFDTAAGLGIDPETICVGCPIRLGPALGSSPPAHGCKGSTETCGTPPRATATG